jgi:uncharacterized membrane protein
MPLADTSTRRLRATLSRGLNVGVVAAALVAGAGGAGMLMSGWSRGVDFGVFSGAPEGVSSIRGVAWGVAAGEAPSLAQLGIIFLLATPVVRVALTFVVFLVQRDRLYATVAAIVLILLALGLGGAHG